MPNLKQSLNILKNGIPKKRSAQDQDQASGSARPIPIRDHYERWTHFYKRQYSKMQLTHLAGVEIEREAVAAARDTPLGIVDTIAREYITHWLPEIMLFDLSLAENGAHTTVADIEVRRLLIDNLRHNVIDALERIQCAKGDNAAMLRLAIFENLESHLTTLFETFEVELQDLERSVYGPIHALTLASIRAAEDEETSLTHEPLTEARILDSSLAWDLSDTRAIPPSLSITPLVQHISGARKRRFSEITASSDPDPDPADNGQVWNSPKLEMKRQKFTFRATTSVKLPIMDSYGKASYRVPSERSPTKVETVDLTEVADETDEDQEDTQQRVTEDRSLASHGVGDSERQCNVM